MRYSTRDLAQSSNICLDRDGQISGGSVGEDSDSRRLTTTHEQRIIQSRPVSASLPVSSNVKDSRYIPR